MGREIGSAALAADGYHARADGLTRLAVVGVAGGGWAGYPLADPTVGLLITATILVLVWHAARTVLTRMLDGVEPEALDVVAPAARHVSGVDDVAEARGRWVGHRLAFELKVVVNAEFTVAEGHGIAKEVRHQILHHVPHVAEVTVDRPRRPGHRAGEGAPPGRTHAQDGLSAHARG